MKRTVLACTVLAFVLGLTYYTSTLTAADPKAEIYEIVSAEQPKADNAVNFTINRNGKKVSFSEMTKGKVVFLNFWGTWCGPCRKEIPDIEKISKEYASKGVMVIGVALERAETLEDKIKKVTDFTGKQGVSYMNVVDHGGFLSKAYGGIQAVPTTYIIGKDGKISEKIVGMLSYSQFVKSIEKAL